MLLIGQQFGNVVADGFHEPTGCGCGSTDSDVFWTFIEPFGIYFSGIGDHVGVRINAVAEVEQHFSVATFATTYE